MLDVLLYLFRVALVDCLEVGNLPENLLVELVQLPLARHFKLLFSLFFAPCLFVLGLMIRFGVLLR